MPPRSTRLMEVAKERLPIRPCLRRIVRTAHIAHAKFRTNLAVADEAHCTDSGRYSMAADFPADAAFQGIVPPSALVQCCTAHRVLDRSWLRSELWPSVSDWQLPVPVPELVRATWFFLAPAIRALWLPRIQGGAGEQGIGVFGRAALQQHEIERPFPAGQIWRHPS